MIDEVRIILDDDGQLVALGNILQADRPLGRSLIRTDDGSWRFVTERGPDRAPTLSSDGYDSMLDAVVALIDR